MYEWTYPWYPMNRSIGGAVVQSVVTVQQIAIHVCGYQRTLVRDIAICVGATAITGGTLQLDFYRRPKHGSNAVKELFARWTPGTTGVAVGNVHIKRGVNCMLIPGQDFIAEVVIGAAAGQIGINLHLDVVGENPSIYPNMKRASG